MNIPAAKHTVVAPNERREIIMSRRILQDEKYRVVCSCWRCGGDCGSDGGSNGDSDGGSDGGDDGGDGGDDVCSSGGGGGGGVSKGESV